MNRRNTATSASGSCSRSVPKVAAPQAVVSPFRHAQDTPHSPRDPWAEAVAHLRALDDDWAALIDRVGPCLLRPRPDRFGTLVRAIIGQQISSKAAASIDARLRALAGDPHAPGGRCSRSARTGCGASGSRG